MSFVFNLYRFFSPVFHAFLRVLSGNLHMGCRFHPTCSIYADEAVRTYGFFYGGRKALLRLLKCHPFSGRGGYDPI